MDLRASLFVVLLWSSCCFSKNESSVAIPSDAFTIYSSLTKIDATNSKSIDNMPRIQSQDTVGSCFGCSASTIVQKFICDTDEEIKSSGVKCSQVSKNQMVSQLSMIAWADTNEDRVDGKASTERPGQPKNHTNIKLYNDRSKYSLGSNALLNAVNNFSFMPESCYPFDQLVNKYGNNVDLFKKIYEKTKNFYNLKKRKVTEAQAPCTDCLEELNKDFGTNFTSDALNNALTKQSFGEFLYTLIFKNCKPIDFANTPAFRQIPEVDFTLQKSQVFEKIKSVIDKKSPVHINEVCLRYNSEKKECNSTHSIVISGYRKACPSNNYNDSKCRQQLKLHNCWGQDWQNLNEDGWVDADKFIEHLNYGESFITAGEISWLQ